MSGNGRYCETATSYFFFDIYFEYSDVTGAYVIYNITPGDITASAWKSGLNFDNTAGQAGITLASGDVVEGFDFYAISDAVGVITGKTITYLQGVPVSVDVSLNDAVTGAPIDGLSTMSYDSGTTIWTYDLGQIPDGDFEIHAAEGEDGFVMLTPQPVSFFNDALTAGTTSIAVAKAVVISVPAPGGELLPTMPLFAGLKHPSAYTGHAVELYDSNGTLVWGGFDDITLEANVLVVQNGNEWSLQYDGPALTLGETYELRVYGLKAGTTYDHIISHSEPQHGFFTVE